MKRLTMILAALALMLAATAGCGNEAEAEARCERALRAYVQDRLPGEDADHACSDVSVERMRQIADRVVEQETARLDHDEDGYVPVSTPTVVGPTGFGCAAGCEGGSKP